MARLHYGPSLKFDLDAAATRKVTETIGAHATRGGWISFTDQHGKQWSILITPASRSVSSRIPNHSPSSDAESIRGSVCQ